MTYNNIDFLLEIESNLELWNYKLNGVHLWPLIRSDILDYAIKSKYEFDQTQPEKRYINYFKPKILFEFVKSGTFFASPKSGFDSFFSTHARNQRFDTEKGKYFDQMYQPYLDLFTNPLIFERSFHTNIKKPRNFEQNTYLFDSIPFFSILKASHSYIKKDYRNDISEFVSIICKNYSCPYTCDKLYRKLYHRFLQSKYVGEFIDTITSSLNNNIAFLHGASYLGGDGLFGFINNRFKENGIVTIELQHGIIHSNHYAYKYPKGNSQFIAKDYLPDYLLTFGRYWNEQIQTPSNLVTVGNPILNSTKNKFENQHPVLSKSILIVSQGTVTSTMVKIAKYLSQKLPNYKIIYKLHPGEVPFKERYQLLEKYSNIKMKTYENIYELIASSEIIVGYNSTTLFEAVAFNNKRIFIVDNDMIPSSIGYKFSTCDELYNAIIDSESGYPSEDPSYFWEPDWESKFSSFLDQIQISHPWQK
ncbi:MAG: hypothetical protein KAW93_05345 [Methanogenium sp.]|nr:hypothetical protein [Methanogenium sp.]